MNKNLPDIMTVAPASIAPLFGRTQYLRGAVVFTLKHTFLSEGFFSLRLVMTTSVKGPDGHRQRKNIVAFFLCILEFFSPHVVTPRQQIPKLKRENVVSYPCFFH